MTKFELGVIAILMLLAGSANAACSYPAAPTNIPDGETATREQMIAAKQEVAKYNEEMTAYLNCIKLEYDSSMAELAKQNAGKSGEEMKAFEAQKQESEKKQIAKHNAAVDEVTAVVDRFNQQLRAFTKKQQGS